MAALTRAQAETSRLAWERALTLLEGCFSELEKWVKAQAYKSTKLLAGLQDGDLNSEDHLWTVMEHVNLVTNIHKAYAQKIVYIESLITKLEEEVLKTPAPTTEEGAVTTTDRQFKVN